MTGFGVFLAIELGLSRSECQPVKKQHSFIAFGVCKQ